MLPDQLLLDLRLWWFKCKAVDSILVWESCRCAWSFGFRIGLSSIFQNDDQSKKKCSSVVLQLQSTICSQCYQESSDKQIH